MMAKSQRKKPSHKTQKRSPVKPRVSELKTKYQVHPALNLFETDSDLLSIRDAAEWATNHLGKKVTPSNISYLIQYGRVRKHGENGSTQISLRELEKYYDSLNRHSEVPWKDRLDEGLYCVLDRVNTYATEGSLQAEEFKLWKRIQNICF